MTAFSALGHQRLRQQARHLLRLRAEVLADRDPEAVHQMRVAARRLRVVLKTFADGYPARPARRLARQVKRLQRALGTVRDTDVLLDQLRDDLTHAPADQRDGIAWLITRQEEQRVGQARVVRRRLRKGKIARLNVLASAALREDGHRPATPQPPEGAFQPALQPAGSLAEHLQPLLLLALAELRRWSASARDPSHDQEQHRLRIAAKRLRYTLELFSDLLPRQAHTSIAALSDLQDALGTLHDQFVLQGIIRDALRGAGRAQGAPHAALARLLEATAREHERRYAAFLACWEGWERDHTLEHIEALARSLSPTPAEQQMCGGLNVEDWPHARQVRRLALTLFHETAPLHRRDERDAALLERGALLHNAGMLIEKRRHHTHAFTLISAASLPGVSAAERHIIACLARYHRRALPSKRHPEYASLDKAAHKRVGHLAALLRLADALDYHHDGRVEQVRVEISEERALLLLTLSPGLDGAEEIKQARAKADLFEQVFKRRVRVEAVESAQG